VARRGTPRRRGLRPDLGAPCGGSHPPAAARTAPGLAGPRSHSWHRPTLVAPPARPAPPAAAGPRWRRPAAGAAAAPLRARPAPAAARRQTRTRPSRSLASRECCRAARDDDAGVGLTSRRRAVPRWRRRTSKGTPPARRAAARPPHRCERSGLDSPRGREARPAAEAISVAQGPQAGLGGRRRPSHHAALSEWPHHGEWRQGTRAVLRMPTRNERGRTTRRFAPRPSCFILD
jgi:hypothetical protein